MRLLNIEQYALQQCLRMPELFRSGEVRELERLGDLATGLSGGERAWLNRMMERLADGGEL